MDLELQATGTIWIIKIFDSLSVNQIQNIETQVRDYITDFEKKFSRFKKDSQLSKFSRGEKCDYDTLLLETIFLGREVSKMTNGIFNIEVGKVLKAKGYGDADGSNLDLGAFAKGLLVDKLSELLKANNIQYFVVNGGGDIYVTSNYGKPITIYIEDPQTLEKTRAIDVMNTAICSSSNAKRRWKQDKQQHFHIDTKELILGVTIIHPSCMIADLVATITMLTGKTYWKQLEQRFGNFNGLIV